MRVANVSRKVSVHHVLPVLFYSMLFIMLNACTGAPVSNVPATSATPPATSTHGVVSPTTSTNEPASRTPLMESANIPVSTKPDIIVKIKDAVQLSFVGSDIHSISSGTVAIPYMKEGNKVTIDFGETVVQNLEIKIPREANLDVALTGGNVVVDTFEGQAVVALASGTIGIKNFIPHGTNAINIKSGTINVSFDRKASFALKAQADVGAIASSYSAIHETRSSMKAEAAGTIGSGSGTLVNLTTGYGTIKIGSV